MRVHHLYGILRTGTPFTRIKNVPREYMRNYSIEGVKAPRSQTLLKHTPWIVFANEAGTTYLSPSGKNEMQSVKYMDAFLVIKRKETGSESFNTTQPF